MTRRAGLTAERLRELLDYDPATGVFKWRTLTKLRLSKGGIAGVVSNGYVVIHMDGCLHHGHRLAWLWMHGTWPTGHIDHIDGVKSHNAIANLRDVSRSVNMQNQRRPRRRNSTGFLGVSVSSDRRRYLGQITIDGKAIHLGSFKTPEEAHAAYLAAKRRLHEGCTI